MDEWDENLQRTFQFFEDLMRVFEDIEKDDELSETDVDVIKEAHNAIARQKPIKPKCQCYGYYSLYHCPTCGKQLFYPPQKYCTNCGQALNWKNFYFDEEI